VSLVAEQLFPKILVTLGTGATTLSDEKIVLAVLPLFGPLDQQAGVASIGALPFQRQCCTICIGLPAGVFQFEHIRSFSRIIRGCFFIRVV
jgi:hypothetical protein